MSEYALETGPERLAAGYGLGTAALPVEVYSGGGGGGTLITKRVVLTAAISLVVLGIALVAILAPLRKADITDAEKTAAYTRATVAGISLLAAGGVATILMAKYGQ